MNDAASGSDGDDEIPAEVENLDADFDYSDTKQAQGKQQVYVEGLGKAVAHLIDFGYIESYRRKNEARQRNPEQDDGEAEITPDQMAEIFAERYVSPDFSMLNGDKVRAMKPLTPSRLLESLMGDDVDVSPNLDGSVNVAEAGNDS